MKGFEIFSNTSSAKVCVGLGGSITNNTGATGGDGFLPQTARWLNVQYLNRWNVINKGIDGHDSWYHLVRLQADVIANNPDLVIYDCTVNDTNSDPFSKCEEAVIRRLRTALPNAHIAAVIFGTVTDRLGVDPTNTKASVSSQAKAVFNRYGIPYADQNTAAVNAFNASKYTLAQIFYDNIHPADVGHQLGKQTLAGILPVALTKVLPALPSPLNDLAGDYSQAPIIRLATDHDAMVGSWAPSGNDEVSSTAGDTITWTGTFCSFGMDTVVGGGITYSWQVDGGAWNNYSPSTSNLTNQLLWYGSRAAHTVVVKVVSGTVTIHRFLAI